MLQRTARGKTDGAADKRRVNRQRDAMRVQGMGVQASQRPAGVDVDHAGNGHRIGHTANVVQNAGVALELHKYGSSTRALEGLRTRDGLGHAARGRTVGAAYDEKARVGACRHGGFNFCDC